MYRPDVDGPAYYEFPVSEGGYLIVSTGQHDVPMTNLSCRGTSVTERLLEQARERAQQFYVNYGYSGTADDQWIGTSTIFYSGAAVP